MKNRSLATGLAAIVCLLLFTVVAQAQLARAYVSRNGNDFNPCTRNAPCRQIIRGIQAVQPGGEVVVLNTGNYAPFTVDKAVTVGAAPGASPGITATSPGNNAVTVAAGTSAVVTLRGLTLNGLSNQNQSGGIGNESSAALFVENCLILNFGIGLGSGSGSPMSIKDTIFKGNSSGIQVAFGRALVDHCRFESNGTGLFVGAGGRVIVRDSAAFGNLRGFYAGTAFAVTDLNIEGCTAANNGIGIHADPEVVIRVANSVITNNTVGLSAQGSGQIVSRTPATNTVAGNGSGETFTGVYAAK